VGSTVHSNLQHSTQLCWCIDTVNIVFTFLYAVFYNCHHSLGFLKGGEFMDWWSSHNCEEIRVLHGDMFFNCYCRKPKQTVISFMQCEMLTIDVFCFMC